MKIFIDVRLLSKGRTTGIEEYTRLLLSHLFKRDDGNEYTLFYNGFFKALLPGEWRGLKHVSVIDSKIPNKILETSLRFFDFPKIELFGKPDIVFSPHFNILRTEPGTKRVITFHDLSPLHFPESFPIRKRYWHWSQDYKRQAREATHLVTISEFTKRDLIDSLGVPEEKISVIYSGINPFYKILDKKSEPMKHFIEKYEMRHPYILYAGVLEPRKNIEALIRAFTILKTKARYNDLRLIIVGERGWLYDKILNAAYHSSASNYIKFWGKASYDDMRSLYNLASVFVYPSFFEGFGFPPLEAQACGAPVVASNRTSLPEVLGNSALLTDPWRIGELVDAIDAFLTDPALREDFCRRGTENIRRFDWNKAAASLQNVFSKVHNA